MLVHLAAVLQVVEGLNLGQGAQQTPREQVDPQHAGRVHTQLQAVQLGIQVRGGHCGRRQGEGEDSVTARRNHLHVTLDLE